jgi:hypothetical protein
MMDTEMTWTLKLSGQTRHRASESHSTQDAAGAARGSPSLARDPPFPRKCISDAARVASSHSGPHLLQVPASPDGTRTSFTTLLSLVCHRHGLRRSRNLAAPSLLPSPRATSSTITGTSVAALNLKQIRGAAQKPSRLRACSRL